jgi:hypothetical protein
MAMTDEELLLQMNILVSKISDNPNMVFKTNKTLNKGLNPEYYSGNDSKIVNILNSLFEKNQQIDIIANNVADKINTLIGDSSSALGAANWEKLQGLMEQATIIEGLNDLFEGKSINKILNINVADKGKVLSIDEDAEGNLVLKAIDAIAGGTGSTNVSVENIEYTNKNVADITNVKEALDYLVDKIVNGDFGDGEWGGGIQMGEITWDMIDDRPEFVADKLEMNSEQLVLKDGETILSTVPLADNTDIDNIINQLD